MLVWLPDGRGTRPSRRSRSLPRSPRQIQSKPKRIGKGAPYRPRCGRLGPQTLVRRLRPARPPIGAGGRARLGMGQREQDAQPACTSPGAGGVPVSLPLSSSQTFIHARPSSRPRGTQFYWILLQLQLQVHTRACHPHPLTWQHIQHLGLQITSILHILSSTFTTCQLTQMAVFPTGQGETLSLINEDVTSLSEGTRLRAARCRAFCSRVPYVYAGGAEGYDEKLRIWRR